MCLQPPARVAPSARNAEQQPAAFAPRRLEEKGTAVLGSDSSTGMHPAAEPG